MAGQTRRFFHFKRNMSAFEEKNAVLASYCLFSSLLFPSFRRIITKNRARQPIASSPRLLFSFPDGPLSSPLSLSQLLSFFLLLLLHRKQVTLRIRFNSIVWKRQSEDICIRYLANVAKSLSRFRTNFRRKFARSKWKISDPFLLNYEQTNYLWEREWKRRYPFTDRLRPIFYLLAFIPLDKNTRDGAAFGADVS